MLTIRRADRADIPNIVRLTTSLAERFITRDCTQEGALNLVDSMNESQTHERFAGAYRYFVACDDGEIVGVVATQEDRHLYHLFVAERYHRRGIGRDLWQIARQACITNGNRGHFTVNSSRGSRGVYESFGFVAQPEVVVNGVPFVPMSLTLD
ncbi:GNAT family N-acetyltransferase [Schlesneria paludicola]|uniref:GNAT family N-acetyltransferase n=1 Tax=Schlesneria paludicola TaxID=360056 RepID=UPI00029B459E|nr:GNAT family N-acetyltransferase [Schlesneria paludicola]